MGIKPEVLQSIKTLYELKTLMQKEQCTPEEKADICLFILSDDDLLTRMIPHLAGLESFVSVFSNEATNSNLEEKIFRKLLSNEASIRLFFGNFYCFNAFYKLFIHSDISLDLRLTRCTDILNKLAATPEISWVKRYGGHGYLANIIHNDTDMQGIILGWAERFGLVESSQDKAIILTKVAEIRKSLEEEKRKQELAVKLKEVTLKVGNRMFSQQRKLPAADRTELHRLASKLGADHADLLNAIALIQNGASLEARDQAGETPLISAALAGNGMMTLLLISWGAKASVVDNDGYAPKLFKLFYECDHEYDESGCIELKRFMDSPMRKLLGKIEGLEKSHLTAENNFYSLEKIKPELLAMVNDNDFQSAKRLAALCGYIFNHVEKHEQQAVCQFFRDNCKTDIANETDLLASFHEVYAKTETSATHREQLHGNSDAGKNPDIVSHKYIRYTI